jgi:hypothetical protein
VAYQWLFYGLIKWSLILHILIICTNQNRQPSPVMPYGACIVAEAAVAAGYRVSLLDLMFQSDPSSALETALRRTSPDVCLSIRNLDNNDMQSPVGSSANW